MAEHFWCPHHDVIRGMKGYREHMDAEHDGRSDVVLQMSSSQVFAVLRDDITPWEAVQPITARR